MINPCLLSPLLFLTNTVIAYIYGYVLYAFLFAQLLLTSLYYHGIGDWTSEVLDKATILVIVCYGSYVFLSKLIGGSFGVGNTVLAALIVGTFLVTIFLYFYGRQKGAYCFDEDSAIANSWHAGIHVATALGHVCIVLL